MDIFITWLVTLLFFTTIVHSATAMGNQTDCNPGFYGNNCTLKCGKCANNNICSSTNGHCTNGCKEGFLAPLCEKNCNVGFYGLNCKKKCGMCRNKNETCSAINGKCKDGCRNGYIAPLCQEPCNFGFYGYNCSRTCGHCHNNETCSAITGECKNGCQDDYIPPICNTGCSSGYYGYNCTQKCGFCKTSKSCNMNTGNCPTGCKDGYIPPLCQKKCNSGFYGYNCIYQCGQCGTNATCSEFTGECNNGCDEPFISPFCNTTQPDLVSNPYIVDLSDDNKVTTENTATIVIPSVKKISQSPNCSLYIIVSTMNSILKMNVEKSNDFKQIILNHSQYEHAWIAKEILELNKEQRTLLGNDEKIKSTQLNETIINYKLEPFTNYEIAIVVINKYNDEILSNVFYTKFQTGLKREESHLYIYIVLLAIPSIIFIGICLYITYKKRQKVDDIYIEPIPGIVTNTYVDNEYLQIIDINTEHKEKFQNLNTESQDDEYDSVGVIQNAVYLNEAPTQEDSTYDEVKSQEHDDDDALYDIVKNSAGAPSIINSNDEQHITKIH